MTINPFRFLKKENNKPINGCHPAYLNMKVYPRLRGGKFPDENFVKQLFIRIFPLKSVLVDDFSIIYDWSHVPNNSTLDAILKASKEIRRRGERGLETRIGQNPWQPLDKRMDDGYWITVKEFERFLEIQKKGFFNYVQQMQNPSLCARKIFKVNPSDQ